jgi:hypothetical protein
MNRFIRPNRQQTNTAGSYRIDFAAAKKPVLLDPGLYRLHLERAELVGRNGNISIALTLTDIASGHIVSTKPMWVHGPNARPGDLAEQHKAVIADLLRLAGQPLDGDTATVISGLAGLQFQGDLGIASDQSGNPFNTLRGAGSADPDQPVRHD